MFYGLYSEGSGLAAPTAAAAMPFFPQQYDSDKLKNWEIGTKNTFANGRVRFNATYFNMKWEDYQLEVVDPSQPACGQDNAPPEPNCGQPWQKVVANVGNAKSQGVEVQFDWAATENLSVGANATWLDAKLTDDVDIGVTVPSGTRLPLSPEFKGSPMPSTTGTWTAFGGSNAWLALQWS